MAHMVDLTCEAGRQRRIHEVQRQMRSEGLVFGHRALDDRVCASSHRDPHIRSGTESNREGWRLQPPHW